MTITIKSSVSKELQKIPGVGEKIAKDLARIGIHSAADLKNRNPENLYLQLCSLKGRMVDRCMLYVFRCAIYYASTKKHDPELLRWWNWKDSKKKSSR
ncbi:MAG: pathogenicity locus [Candidatus Cloacimonadota bacterium]|nr:MAG: pathogenicity locus [Candidatus Cloacimonadota bacterium]